MVEQHSQFVGPLTFRRLQREDFPVLDRWFQDETLRRRISPPDDTWREYIMRDNGVSRSWVGIDAQGNLVTEVQVDQKLTTDPGYINFYINPALRGRGLGPLILQSFLDGPGREFPEIEASIEPDNLASLKCFRKVGFVEMEEQNEPGMIRLFRQQ